MAQPASLSFLATVLREMYELDVKYPAAAVAYYAFLSLLPMLVVVLAVIGEQMAVQVFELTPAFLTPDAQLLIHESLTSAEGRTHALVLAFVVLVWCLGNIAVGLQTALARIDGRSSPGSGRELVVGAAVVIGVLLAAIVAVGVVSALPSLVPGLPVVELVGSILLFATLTAAFTPLYRTCCRSRTVLAVLPGALIAAGSWTVLQTVVQFYAANAGQFALYGVLSSVLLLVTSLYVAALALLVGAIVNETLSREAWSSRGGPAHET